MKKELFNIAFLFILQVEGYKTGADDPGGRNIYGISERFHPGTVKRIWDKPKRHQVAAVKKVYFREYWTPIVTTFRGLPDKEYIFLFDTAVNCGIKKAVEWRILKHDLLSLFCIRLEHYTRISKKKKYKRYLRGWNNRLLKLKAFIDTQEKGEKSWK
ncbi:MAG: hypothetical protein GY757_40120 [bacterium]|nr:hypothetical protein [bacterium]